MYHRNATLCNETVGRFPQRLVPFPFEIGYFRIADPPRESEAMTPILTRLTTRIQHTEEDRVEGKLVYRSNPDIRGRCRRIAGPRPESEAPTPVLAWLTARIPIPNDNLGEKLFFRSYPVKSRHLMALPLWAGSGAGDAGLAQGPPPLNCTNVLIGHSSMVRELDGGWQGHKCQ